MFAILISGVASAQSGAGVSLSGNMLFADSHLNNNIETGAGFTLKFNADIVKSGFILGPTVGIASFGTVTPIGSGDSRDLSSYASAGLQSGFSKGRYDFIVSYELPFETNKGHGLVFESMLSGKIKQKFNKDKPLGIFFHYDYFFNKDTFYYTSQAGLGLFLQF